MATTHRTQILMDPVEYDALARLAVRRRVSVGELIRLAVRAQYLDTVETRMSVVDSIAAMAVAVPDWAELKRDLEDSYDAGIP